jgi:hypothetical protein
MTLKLIFLDIDGPLVNFRSCIAEGNVGGKLSYFDPIACKLLRQICFETNSRLVISSSWRKDHERSGMVAILNAACANLGNYILADSEFGERWRTPTYCREHTCRGDEINSWMDSFCHEQCQFVILDDDSDMGTLQNHLVKCDTYDGIGFHQYKKCLELLA